MSYKIPRAGDRLVPVLRDTWLPFNNTVELRKDDHRWGQIYKKVAVVGLTVITFCFGLFRRPIARNGGHLTLVINCQRHLIFKMADKNYRSQGKHVPYDILNNLSSVDVLRRKKQEKKSSKNDLGTYQGERLIARKQDADVRKTLLH